MSLKRLIVNADDLGLHPGINSGILRSHREGIVTSASLSPNGAAFEHAVRVLGDAPELAVGVHLTLVDEAPLSPREQLPTLAPGGRLPRTFTTLFRRLLLGRVREREVERELVAQVARARDAGVRPSHLDSHQHVHLHPALLPVALRVADRFGIRAIRAAPRVLPMSGLRPALLAGFAKLGARRIRAAGLRTPDAFFGMQETGRLDESRLIELVARLPRGTSELVCHPGSEDAAIAQAYPWGFRWEREQAALTSSLVRDALVREGVQLVSYRDL